MRGLQRPPEELDHYRLVAATPALRKARSVLPRELLDADSWLATLERDVIQSLRAQRTLLIHPLKDALAKSCVRKLGRMLPESVVLRLPGAGHFFQQDSPSQIADAIQECFRPSDAR